MTFPEVPLRSANQSINRTAHLACDLQKGSWEVCPEILGSRLRAGSTSGAHLQLRYAKNAKQASRLYRAPNSTGDLEVERRGDVEAEMFERGGPPEALVSI